MAMLCDEDDPLPSVRFEGGDPALPPLLCSVARIPSR
jgi:hypothetical protein